jgi:hypothetical protein
MTTSAIAPASVAGAQTLPEARRSRYDRALLLFLAVVLAHWVEHVVQALQVFALGWSRPDARGALGLLWPALVQSEALHYGYAIVMLVGLVLLRPAFTGQARTWWTVALALQIWHHAEHLLLLSQAVAGHPFFGAQQYTSLLQLAFPRIELHLFYNAVVFVPMCVAMYLRWSARVAPPASDARTASVDQPPRTSSSW